MNDTGIGFALLLAAGAMNGSFTLPMKFTRRWAWENTWLVWTVFALVIFPPLLAFATVPALGTVYGEGGTKFVVLAASFGAGWGVSQVFFGLAVEAVGIALAFSVILGISAAVGSLLPLALHHAEKIATRSGLYIIGGVALVLIGVGICAVAGRRRESALGLGPAEGKPSVGRGLLFCTISGLGSALVGMGLEFARPLQLAAERAGASPAWAPNAIWLPLMTAGAIPNLIYCGYLLKKNSTANRFQSAQTMPYWLLAALMALFWFGSTATYGVSTTKLGNLGTVLAWPLFMSLIVITASLWGVATGEWKNTGKPPLRIMTTGVAVLVVAVFVLAAASRLNQ